MSSAVISTSAALSRPFLFDADAEPQVGAPLPASRKPAESVIHAVQSTIKNQRSPIPVVTPASQLAIRPAPEMASSGIAELDALTGGLPRGCLTEICGPASSGRTTVLLAALAAASRRGEFCAVIDAADSLDPLSVAAAGVDLDRLLWVRCGESSPQRNQTTKKSGDEKAGCSSPDASFAARVGISPQATFDFDRTGLTKNSSRQSEYCLEQVLRTTDLLLESGGFGLIILDLAEVPSQAARHIPLTTWFRFRRAVEHKPTILLAIEQQPIAGSCSSLLLQLEAAGRRKNSAHGASRGIESEIETASKKRKEICDPTHTEIPHTNLLTGLHVHAELIRSRLERKPAHSIAFATKTAWAG